jgi:hypothetical protein
MDTVVLLALGLVLLAVLGLFAFYVQGVHRADEDRLEMIEPRFARLAGLATDKGQRWRRPGPPCRATSIRQTGTSARPATTRNSARETSFPAPAWRC